jgi:hypothetical protein
MINTALSSLCPSRQESLIGYVLEVKHSGLLLGLLENEIDAIQPRGEYGDFLICDLNGAYIYGQITEVRYNLDKLRIEKIARIAHFKPLVSIMHETNRIIDGIIGHPSIGAVVYPASQDLTFAVSQGLFRGSAEESVVKLSFATLRSGIGTELSFIPEKVFGRHCAVLGTTGGGKSWTVAKLVEECSNCNSKIILLDASGEYSSLERGVKHIHFGSDVSAPKISKQISLPYFHLTESDLFAMFHPSGPSQAPKLSSAMKSLKLARLAPALAPGGTILKAHRPKVDYLQEFESHIGEIDSPFATFDISKLAAQIENECVNPQSSPVEPMIWGGSNAIDQANCVPLIGRINDMINSPGLAPIFHPRGVASLFDELLYFLEDKNKRILCISLRNLSFAHHVREIVTNAIGRNLLEMAREGTFKIQPLVLFIDEAHQFLNEYLDQESSQYFTNSFALIAKEGRKYGFTLCLATQRPRDIPEGILSQMGTLIIHRLINDYDRGVVERASGELDKATASAIPSLGSGEAVLLGVDFSVPLQIKVTPPVAKPNSYGPNYQEGWNMPTKKGEASKK